MAKFCKRFVLFIFNCSLFIPLLHAQQTVSMQINAKANNDKISKYIYGHFAEDLGRCIYDGFWG